MDGERQGQMRQAAAIQSVLFFMVAVIATAWGWLLFPSSIPSVRADDEALMFLWFDRPNIHGGFLFRQEASESLHPKTEMYVVADIPRLDIVHWTIDIIVPANVSLGVNTPGVVLTKQRMQADDLGGQPSHFASYRMSGALRGPRNDAQTLVDAANGHRWFSLASGFAIEHDPAIDRRKQIFIDVSWAGPSSALESGPYVRILGPNIFTLDASPGYPARDFIALEEFLPPVDPLTFATQAGSPPGQIGSNYWRWILDKDGYGPHNLQTNIPLQAAEQESQFGAGILLGVAGGAVIGFMSSIVVVILTLRRESASDGQETGRRAPGGVAD